MVPYEIRECYILVLNILIFSDSVLNAFSEDIINMLEPV